MIPAPPLSPNLFRYQKCSEKQKGSSTKFFGTLRQQIFFRKSWYSPLRHKILRYVKLSETQKGSSTKWFGTETKLFWRKILIPAPFLNPNIFRYQKFSETRVPLRNFSVLWDKNFDMKSWYSLPPSPPLLSMKFFDTRNLVKHRRSPLRNFSVLWDNRFSIENRDIPLLGIKFFDTWNFLTQGFLYEMIRYWDKTSETQKGSSTKFIGTVRQQFFYRKSWYSPLIHKIFRYQNFLPTKFLVLWNNRFSIENRDIPLLSIKFFDTRIFYLRSFSVLWNNRFSIENRDILFWNIKFFDTWNFLRHRRVPLRTDSVLWDRNFDIKSWYSLPPPPPLLSINFFDTRNFAKHRRFPLRSFFGTLRQQIFYRKSWYSPLWHKIFQYVNFSETEGFLFEMIRYWDKTSETQKGSSMKWFGTETKKFWTENRDAPPPPSSS